MPFFADVTADQLILAMLATIALRELLIVVLPERLAGPNGLLIRTEPGEH